MSAPTSSKKRDQNIYTPRQVYSDRAATKTDVYAPLEVRIGTIDTTLLLLDSTEDQVLASVFKHMTEFMLKQDKNIVLLREKNLLDLLLEKDFFIESTNTIIKRFALYDADLIIESMNTLTDMDTSKTQSIVELALEFYLKESDDFCLEYLSVIINKCCDDPRVAYTVTLAEEFLKKFYELIAHTTNPDILLHSFEALHKILQVQNVEEQKAAVLHELFPIDRILCDIANEYSEIRTAALRLVKLLIMDTSETNPILANGRNIYLFEQLSKVFRTPDMSDSLKDVVETLATTVRVEPMAKIFFERNFFDRIVSHLRTQTYNFPREVKCLVLSIFAETAKFPQFLYRLHMAQVTDMLISCILEMESPTTDPPAMHTIQGLNRLMKLPDASERIVDAYKLSLLVKLLQILTCNEVSIKTREQVAELFGNLLTFAFVITADELMELNFPSLLAEILSQQIEELSIDLIISLLSVIEALAQNEDYRTQLGKEPILSHSLAFLLKNSFSTAVLTAKLFRCLCTLIDEEPVRQSLLLLYLSSSMKRALKSLSNLVKSSVTNFIMQTTRFPDFVQEYISAGVLEVLIMNQKHSHCVTTWGPAIESILSKTPTLKFCIRNNLGFTDNTAGQDFHVSKKKFEDFREFQSILREEVSPLQPVFIVNFDRERDPSEMVIFIPPGMFTEMNMGAGFNGWCYCRRPGDDMLPRLLEKLNMTLDTHNLRTDAAHARRCIDFENLSKRVKIVAQLVSEQLGNDLEPLDLNSTQECSEHAVKCHLKQVCVKMHCSILPLGKVRTGCMFERAVLFKCLADQIGLPATLQRSVDGLVLFNEVPLPVEIDRDIHCDANTMKFMPWRMLRPTHVVDLMYTVGELYPLQSRQALQYLRLY